jgi:GNAT superfamily N-acetyltransferase
MTAVTWEESPLGRHHDRKAFDCGDADLNDYFHRYARQNHDSGGAKCFVATTSDSPSRILGFYTLSPASLGFARVPELVRKGLGRYDVPVFKLGCLAIDGAMQGRGLGSALVLRAADRCMRVAVEVGGVALLIDAKGDGIAVWYERLGAVRLPDTPLSLILPLRATTSGIDETR